MLQQKLGKRIAESRQARDRTQAQLAQAVGCSVEFIILVGRGANAPSGARLEHYAQALRVAVAELFTLRWPKRAHHSLGR